MTQAKFEAGRPGADEVVLARVLDVLAALAAGPEGPALPHDALLAAFQAMYRIGHYRTQRGRETSELLTQAARRAMGEVVEAVFARVGAGGLGGGRVGGAASPALAHAARLRVGGGRGSAGGSAVGSPTHAAGGGDANGAAAAAEGAPGASPPVPPLPAPLPAPLEIVSLLPDEDDDSASDGAGVATPPRPLPVAAPRGAAAGYGEDAARELLLFLVALVGAPAPRSAAAAAPPPGLPALGLRLAAAALAAAGPALGGRPALLAVLQEDLVRAMFAAGASDGAGGPPSLAALSGVCQLALSLYLHLGAPLLLQLEALLALLLLPLAEGAPGTAAEGRPPLQQAALEGVLAFAAQPRFAVDAFVNADCRVERANLFERLCALLSKAAFPVGGPLGPVHTLALDGVVAVLGALDDAAAGEDGGDADGGADGGDGSAAGGSDAGSEDEAEDFSGEPAAFVDIWTPLCAGEAPPAAAALGAAAATPGAAARAECALKARLAAAAERFNEDPRKGLAYLTALKLLPAEPDAGAVARCLRACPGLEKAAIGEVLGERDEFHDAVRAAFGATFDFAGLPFDAALRLFMDSFRPPGEGQKIDRIMQVRILCVSCVLVVVYYPLLIRLLPTIASICRAISALFLSSLRLPSHILHPPTHPITQLFGARYHAAAGAGAGLASPDAAYVLAFSVVMLNTDLHNSQNKRKMTPADFARINDATNDGAPMPPALLGAIFESISAGELKISTECAPGELPAQAAFWAELARRARAPRGRMGPPARAGRATRARMFDLAWGPSLAAVSVILDGTDDAGVAARAAGGLLAAARLAARFGAGGVADRVVELLARHAGAGLSPALGPKAGAAAFGASPKARVAAEAVFAVAARHGDALREGWRHVLDLVVRLHALGLLPPEAIAADGEAPAEASARLPAPAARGSRGSQGSLFSRAINSLISIDGADAASGEAAAAAEAAALAAAAASARACRVPEIIGDSKFLTGEALVALARAAAWAGGDVAAAARGAADPAAAELALELLVALALRNRDRVALIWPLAHEYLAACTAPANAPAPGPLPRRAVLGLLRIAQRLLPYRPDAAPQLLGSLRLALGLAPPVAWELAPALAAGLGALLASSARYVRAEGDWRTVCALVRATAARPDAAPAALEALQAVARDPGALSGENYMPLMEASLALLERYKGASPGAALALLDVVEALVAWLLQEGALPLPPEADGGGEGGEAAGEAAFSSPSAAGTPSAAPRRRRLSDAALLELWLASVGILAKGLAADEAPALRDSALGALGRALGGSGALALPAEVWVQTSREMLVPLVARLAAAAAAAPARARAPLGKSARLAVNTLAKTLLQYAPLMATDRDFGPLWEAALGALADAAAVRSEALQEAVPENAKNLLLVLAAGGLLRPEWADAEGRPLWEPTWRLAARIAPGLTPAMLAGAGVGAASAAAEAEAAAAGAAAAAAVAQPAVPVAVPVAMPVAVPAAAAALNQELSFGPPAHLADAAAAPEPARAPAAADAAPSPPAAAAAPEAEHSEAELAEQANGCKQS